MLLYIPLEIILLITLMKSCKIYTYQYMLIDPQGLCSKGVLFKGITWDLQCSFSQVPLKNPILQQENGISTVTKNLMYAYLKTAKSIWYYMYKSHSQMGLKFEIQEEVNHMYSSHWGFGWPPLRVSYWFLLSIELKLAPLCSDIFNKIWGARKQVSFG